MKSIFITTVLCILFLAGTSHSQFSEKDHSNQFLVLNTSVIKANDIERVQDLMDSHFAEILNDLVEEGKLESWGYLSQGLMDNGKYSIYYITSNQLAFENFWLEYTRRNAEKHPAQWSELTRCFSSDRYMGHSNNLTQTVLPIK